MQLIKQLLKAAGILVLIAAVGILYVLYRGGTFRSIEPHFAGVCTSLPLEGSVEDITVDRERGIAYLSFMDRAALIKGQAVQGTVLRLDLNRVPLATEEALASKPAHLRPHGLSLYRDPNGQRYLMVINHPVNRGREPELVEIFREVEPGRFAHHETIMSPQFNSPNDLVAVGPRQFYVANDKTLKGRVAAGLQQFGIGASPLTWFDGQKSRVVLDDIASGGGINASSDGSTLYVAETAGQRIRVLKRDPASGNVAEAGRIAVPTSPDNIDVAADASLTVAGHPNTLKLIRHFINGSPSPSQVLRVIPDNGGTAAVDEIYLDDGSRIPAASVGVTYGDKLLIGSITSPQLLVCEQR